MVNDPHLFGTRWATAELHADVPALGELLTEDFVGIGPHGFMLDKPQWLERYTSGSLVHTAFSWDEVRIREYGDTVVATGVQQQESTYQGHATDGRFRGTQVLVARDGRWRLAAMHLSNLASGA